MIRPSLLLAALLPLFAGALPAQEPTPPPAPPVNDSGDPPSRVARISYLSGDVSLQGSGDTAWSQASLNYPMTTGDRLYVDAGGRVELQLGGLAVRLDGATDLTVTDLSDALVQLGLTSGTARISVYRLDEDDSVEVDTPRGVLTLLAVGDYRISAPADDTAMTVSVERGQLEWTAGGVAQLVQAGQAVQVSGVNPIQVASVASPGPDGFGVWCAARDHRVEKSASAQYVSKDVPGYADLDDAGSWETDASYGPVWYPTVGVDWVPYRYGRWVWVEPWGWTWVESEPWGYAPFHYGRWVRVGPRWGWLPGPVAVRPYYAPALVVFVSGSSWGAQAWFPLGPGEPYHPWYHHGRGYAQHVNINVTTINVTNVNTYNYRNRGVATTAVPTRVFQAGEPVRGRILRVNAAQIGRAPVVPHPAALPTVAATFGGRRVAPPPVSRRPDFFTARPPVAPRPALPAAGQPLVVPRNEPPRAAPTLITRRPPPPQDPPFADRQRAMKPDAGRPLEPQQIDNLRKGQPAGPRHDSEFPPHPVVKPAPRPPAAQPAARPAPRQAPPPKPKDDSKNQGRRGPGK